MFSANVFVYTGHVFAIFITKFNTNLAKISQKCLEPLCGHIANLVEIDYKGKCTGSSFDLFYLFITFYC